MDEALQRCAPGRGEHHLNLPPKLRRWIPRRLRISAAAARAAHKAAEPNGDGDKRAVLLELGANHPAAGGGETCFI